MRHIDTENIAMITPSYQQGEPLSGAIFTRWRDLRSLSFFLYISRCVWADASSGCLPNSEQQQIIFLSY